MQPVYLCEVVGTPCLEEGHQPEKGIYSLFLLGCHDLWCLLNIFTIWGALKAHPKAIFVLQPIAGFGRNPRFFPLFKWVAVQIFGLDRFHFLETHPDEVEACTAQLLRAATQLQTN